ncbi:MAG: cell division protein ZipA [Spongiibacteraceae bacterium]
MEFSVREWTIIVGVLLIVAVFLDGYRRVRNERSNRIRVSLSKQVFSQAPVAPAVEDGPNPELPNGGARVIGKRREDLRLQQSLNTRPSVPVLIEPVAVEPITSVVEIAEQDRVEEDFAAEAQALSIEQSEFVIDEPDDVVEESEPFVEQQLDAFAVEPAVEEPQLDDEFAVAESDDSIRDEDDAPIDVLNLFDRKGLESATPLKPLRKFFNRKDSIVVAEPEPEPIEPQEVLIVNVLSKGGDGFKGPDLLQLLLACDLRFGKKNIFHRYEKANAKGSIQFSVANLVEPGTFDLDAIDDFVTPGVSFFMSLPGPEKPLVAFNYMIETAQVLVRHLHAELRDDAHSVMTAQTIEHCRQRIRDFERKQLTLQL